MNPPSINRRRALGAAATAALAAPAIVAAQGGARRPLRFDDPVWNRDMKARMEAPVDPKKFSYGYVTGTVAGVRDGERVRPLMRFDVFSTIRILPQADGSFHRLCREVVFYRNLATGQLMDQWDNPYTGERVRVVDVANDPFNYKISEWYPDPPRYGGLNKDKPPRRPFLLNWNTLGPDTVTLETDIHLLYPSALRPEKWPRESPGPMTRVSEMFRFFMRREHMEDAGRDFIPSDGVWSRITPWLPWMLMDQAPGHIVYLGNMATRDTMELHKADVLQRVKERYPKYLVAPAVWEDPSLSSLERYAREQTPAAPRAK